MLDSLLVLMATLDFSVFTEAATAAAKVLAEPAEPMPVVSHTVELWKTLFFAAILVAMIATLALEEKIHAKKSMITCSFAIISLFLGTILGILPWGGADTIELTKLGHPSDLVMPIYVPAVNWEVICIIFGSSLFVDASSKSGLFGWIAIKLTKASEGDLWKLLVYYGLMTVVFSAVLNNVTAMIIVGSLTGVSLKKLEQQDKLLGFLMIEGLLTNIGGLLTLISSVPNIIVGGDANISFMNFFIVAAPYVVLATAITIVMGRKIFKIEPHTDPEAAAEAKERVMTFDERDGIESERFFTFSAILLGLFITGFATASILPADLNKLGMGFVALTFGFVALARFKDKVDVFYKALDWDLLLFFASLFIVINVMEHAMVLHAIGEGLEHIIALGATMGSAVLLVAAALASSVTDNIPLAAVLSKALFANIGAEDPSNPLWWAVIFGANLGGNLTPIGSASTVVAVTIMHKHDLGVSFLGFVKLALPFAIVQIVLAIIYVVIYSLIVG